MILEFLKVFLCLHLHFLFFAAITVLANKKFKLPAEIFRKSLHMIAVFSILPIVLASGSWVISALVAALFAAEAYIGTKFGNIEKNVAMKERYAGEQQKSMLLLFATYIIIIGVCWGLLGHQWAAVASVLAWGVGDALAAIIGKRFGKHKIQGKFIEGQKSMEGTLAMFVSAFITVLLVLFALTAFPYWVCILVTFWIALFATLAELFSKNGRDTFFCPTSSMLGFVILIMVIGGI